MIEDDGLRRYLRLRLDDDIDMPPDGGSVRIWQCPHCRGYLREHYPREPQFGDSGVCGYCQGLMDLGDGRAHKPGEIGVMILALPSGEYVAGIRESETLYRRWGTGEEVHPTGFAVVSYHALWRGDYDDQCPDLVALKAPFPDMAAMAEWMLATKQ